MWNQPLLLLELQWSHPELIPSDASHATEGKGVDGDANTQTDQKRVLQDNLDRLEVVRAWEHVLPYQLPFHSVRHRLWQEEQEEPHADQVRA